MNFWINKYIILVVLLSLFWWLYYWIDKYSEKSRVLVDNYWYNFSDVDWKNLKTQKYEISNSEYIYTWTWEFTPDPEKIKKLIWEIKSISIKSIASNNKSNFEKFWISGSWSFTIIDWKKILLWNNRWYYGEEYIGIDWINKVFVIDKNLKNILNKESDYFKKSKVEKTGTWEIIKESKWITWTWVVK